MILALSPRLTGKQMHVLIRSGDADKATRSNGLLTFNVAEYRAFVLLLKQGAAMTSPGTILRIDDVQIGGV